jgi:hypothetical protein
MIVMVYTMVYIYGLYHDIYHLPLLYIPWYIPKVVYGIYHEATSVPDGPPPGQARWPGPERAGPRLPGGPHTVTVTRTVAP